MLNDLVAELASARKAVSDAHESMCLAREALEATPEYKALEEAKLALKAAQEAESDVDQRLREAALRYYKEHGEKRPNEHVQIRLYTRLLYDPEIALGYCQAHLPQALKLDRRTFERAAKAIDLDFVVRETAPRVVVSRKLP